MIHDNNNTDKSTSYLSLQARKLKSTSELGEAVQILQEMINSGLHDCAPPPWQDIFPLLCFMKRNAANETVQVKVFEVLLALSNNFESKISIAKADGARCVTESMRKHPDHVNIQELGCALLANIAVVAATLVQKVGGIQILLSAMERFRERATIQMSVCNAILASTRTLAPEAQAKCIVSFGVIEPVIKAMEVHGSHAKVQELCCQVLSAVSTSKDGAVEIAKGGGIGLLVGAIERYPHRASLQEHVCRAIYLFGLTKDQNHRNSIADAGGAVLVLRALHRHADNELVQQQGYLALTALVYKVGFPNTRNCELVVREHGFASILNSMKKYIGNECIQYACIRVSRALMGSDSKLFRAIANAGILKLTVAALSEHPDCDFLQQEGLYMLASLSNFLHSLKDRVVSEGGIDLLMTAMRHHEHDPYVLQSGCRLMNILGRDPLYCALIIAAGGIECVKNAMEINKNYTPLLEAGAKFLSLTDNADVTVLSVAAAAA